jgi:CBS domain-containing protein
MKVRDLMSTPARSCRPDSDLASVVKVMAENDCGVVPVTDLAGKVVGVVTDRDICIATATRRVLPEQLTAEQVMTKRVATCGPDDSIGAVLSTMHDRQVRRVPVVDDLGRLQGMVSLNDIVLAADGKVDLNSAEIVRTFAGICAHRHPSLVTS